MAKIRVTRRFHFEMAHALWGYDGLCSNIHGHSYQLDITVSGETGHCPGDPKDGMVIDFHVLKSLVKTNITDRLDHALMMNSLNPALNSEILQQITGRIVQVDFQPTTENLIAHIAQLLIPLLPPGISLFSVRLFETDSSYAEWFAADNQKEPSE